MSNFMHHTACFLLALLATSCVTRRVAILPLDGCTPRQISVVTAALKQRYQCSITVLPPTPGPRSAWYAPRQRYLADEAVAALAPRKPPGADVLLGITDKDLGVHLIGERASGIMGMAEPDQGVGIASSHRLRLSAASDALFDARLGKVAAHELGHCFGLLHCSDRQCLMQAAQGSIFTYDAIEGKLCASCQSKLRRHDARMTASELIRYYEAQMKQKSQR
jgi:archaemetzincin